MIKKTAAQKRLLQNATLIVATRLVFEELRQHFPIRQLSDAMTIFNGQALKKFDRLIDGEYDVYGSGGKVGQFSDFLSDKPFVVIGRKGSAGKPTYAPNGGWVIDTAYFARPSNEDIDTKFLFYALSSLDFANDIISTAIPGINQTAIYRYDIPVPPLELQIKIKTYLDAVANKTALPKLSDLFIEINRIVERVDTLVTRIAKAQSLREEADREAEFLFQSRINELLEEKAGTWRMATLPEFVSTSRHAIKRGPFGSHLRKEFFVESGYKIYEQKHAIYGDFKIGRYYIDENKFQELKSFRVEAGDLIISCSGTIGKVAIVPEEAEPGIINQALLKITLDTNKIDRRFFKLVFESDFIKKEVEAISPGSAMKNIGSVKILKKILFPFPSLDEQRHIVAYLDSIQARLASLRELQSATGEELDALLPSVLDRAFKGEL